MNILVVVKKNNTNIKKYQQKVTGNIRNERVDKKLDEYFDCGVCAGEFCVDLFDQDNTNIKNWRCCVVGDHKIGTNNVMNILAVVL